MAADGRFVGSVIASMPQKHITLRKKWSWNENNHYRGKTGQKKTHQWELDGWTSVDAVFCSWVLGHWCFSSNFMWMTLSKSDDSKYLNQKDVSLACYSFHRMYRLKTPPKNLKKDHGLNYQPLNWSRFQLSTVQRYKLPKVCPLRIFQVSIVSWCWGMTPFGSPNGKVRSIFVLRMRRANDVWHAACVKFLQNWGRPISS